MTYQQTSIIELPPLNLSQDEPVLFDELSTPEIPATVLPDILSDYANALAETTETPPALSVMTILGVVSACVAKRFKVSPKENWHEPLNIYTMIALPPANQKSFVLNSCTQPLLDWEQTQAVLLKDEIKRQRSERKNQEKCIELLRTRAAKEMDVEKQKQLFQEINQLEIDLIEPMVLPSLFANDATPESLIQCVYEQGGRFSLFSDEGGILETLTGLYNHGHANVDILLKGIDGGVLRVQRRDRRFSINPYLTLVLAIQPTVIRRLIDKKALLGNGALERFLYVLPKSKLGFRTHNQSTIPLTIQNAYHAKIQSLLNIPPLLQNDIEQARSLLLSPSAHYEWRDFQAWVEHQLRPDGKFAACLGWGGKISGFALRLAGLMHVATFGESEPMVGEETMDKALTLSALLIEHAIAAYNLMGSEQATEDAKEILQWIQMQSKTCFTQTAITSAMRNRKLGKADRLHQALKILIDRNILTKQIINTNKKQTLVYFVHTALLKKTFSSE